MVKILALIFTLGILDSRNLAGAARTRRLTSLARDFNVDCQIQPGGYAEQT